MVFLSIATALYDYQPQGENELAIREGDLLYIVEKGEDDWWKAKKKAPGEDEEEPVGLIPSNYVEEVSNQEETDHSVEAKAFTVRPRTWARLSLAHRPRRYKGPSGSARLTLPCS